MKYFIQNPLQLQHIQTPDVSKPQHVQKTRYSKNRESLCNLGKFTTLLAYSIPSILKYSESCQTFMMVRFLQPLYKSGMFRTRGIFRTLSNISTIDNAIQNYLLPQHTQNLSILRMQGMFRMLSNIYHEICHSNPCITVAYSEP